jgi:hypothetical protein
VIFSTGIRFTDARVAITLSATASDIDLALPHYTRVVAQPIRLKYTFAIRDSLNIRP